MHEDEQWKCSSELPELYLSNFVLGEMGLHWPCVIHWTEMDLACFFGQYIYIVVHFMLTFLAKKNSLKENEQ